MSIKYSNKVNYFFGINFSKCLLRLKHSYDLLKQLPRGVIRRNEYLFQQKISSVLYPFRIPRNTHFCRVNKYQW